jgi:hypothetical protein
LIKIFHLNLYLCFCKKLNNILKSYKFLYYRDDHSFLLYNLHSYIILIDFNFEINAFNFLIILSLFKVMIIITLINDNRSEKRISLW